MSKKTKEAQATVQPKTERALVLGGKRYVLGTSLPAVIEFEEKTGIAPMVLIARLSQGNVRISDVRDLLWGLLISKQREVTREDCTQILAAEFGQFAQLMPMLINMYGEDLDPGSGAERPQDAQGGEASVSAD